MKRKRKRGRQASQSKSQHEAKHVVEHFSKFCFHRLSSNVVNRLDFEGKPSLLVRVNPEKILLASYELRLRLNSCAWQACSHTFTRSGLLDILYRGGQLKKILTALTLSGAHIS